MSTADAAADPRPAPAALRVRLLRLARTALPAGTLLIALLLSWHYTAIPAEQRIGPDFSLLDGSWRVELATGPSRGQLAGRDFVFTYGPLFQLVHAAGALVPPGDVASVMRYELTAEMLLSAVLLWLLAGIVTPRPLVRSAMTLGWLVLFGPMFLKPLAAILAVAFAAGSLARPDTRASRAVWIGAAPLLTLYSFDLGVFSLLALLAVAAGAAALTFGRQPQEARAARIRAARAAGMAVGGFALVALATRLLPGWSAYLPMSWDVAQGYSAKMALAIKPGDLRRLVLFGAAAAVVLAGLGWVLRRDREKDPFGYAAAGSVLFAAAWLRYGITRADTGHVDAACLPSLLALGFLVPAFAATRFPRWGWTAFGVGIVFASVWSPFGGLRAAVTTVPARLAYVARTERAPARLKVEHPALAEGVDAIRRHGLQDVYAWPWQTVVHPLAGTRNASRTLQSYNAGTDALERADIAALDAKPEVHALLFRDGRPLDGVQSQTRTSLVFRHLLERYELAEPPGDHVAVLRRASGDSPRYRAEKVAGAAIYRTGDGRGLGLRLADGCCRLNDVLALDLRSARTPTLAGFGKPGRLVVALVLANGQVAAQVVPLPQDGESHRVLLSLSNPRDPMFFAAFAPERGWHASERVVAVQMQWQPLDRLSRRPERIEVEGISVLRRADGAEVIESSWARRTETALQDWVYGRSDEKPAP